MRSNGEHDRRPWDGKTVRSAAAAAATNRTSTSASASASSQGAVFERLFESVCVCMLIPEGRIGSVQQDELIPIRNNTSGRPSETKACRLVWAGGVNAEMICTCVTRRQDCFNSIAQIPVHTISTNSTYPISFQVCNTQRSPGVRPPSTAAHRQPAARTHVKQNALINYPR